MPYQKHIWVSKEIIKRQYLQNMEDGIYNEEQRAIESENDLQTTISNEVTRASAKENLLQGNIANEVARATEAEEQIASDVLEETSRATNEETLLSDRISNEYTRATTAEASLSVRIDNVETKATRAYHASGSIYFADLPPLVPERIGNVYNIKDDFITTADFIEGAGKSFSAGTNVAIEQIEETNYIEVTPVGSENPSEEGWYEYDETEDNYFLSTDTEVDATKTYNIRADYVLYYDIPSGFIDTSDFITNTDYATSLNAGIVKPDGTTTTVDANGVLSVVGTEFYLEQSAILSDSEDTTVTFTDARILSTSVIDAYTTVDGLDYLSMSTTAGSCVLVFEQQDTSISISVRIYIK